MIVVTGELNRGVVLLYWFGTNSMIRGNETRPQIVDLLEHSRSFEDSI